MYDFSASDLSQKLSQGDIDLWCYPEIVGKYFIQQSTDATSSFEVVYALENIDSYFAFSKDVSDSTISAFQREIDTLKQDDGSGTSTYDRIVTQYIPSLGSANPN